MKLYTITRPVQELNGDDVDGKIIFAGTQADARKKRIELEAEFKHLKVKERPEVTVEEVDVPTDKAGLISYLNALVG